MCRLRHFPIEFSNSRGRHCEPTGRANARPMTGSAKQFQTPSFRGDAEHRTRNLEIPGLVLRTIPE